MKPRGVPSAVVLAVASLLVAPLLMTASARASQRAAASGICASSSHPALAARLGRAVEAARRGRVSFVAVEVDDPGAGVVCRLDTTSHFDSASVVKVTILGALLRKAQAGHRSLTRAERALAWAMITRSDNGAASALWARTGRYWLQHFLNLAGMTGTFLGPGRAWGLTRITAADETRLLWLLLEPNRVLGTSSRDYALGLMAHVIPSQRWGVPAGAPRRLIVHVKNGWLPLAPHRWRINSIGGFTGHGSRYSIVVLTQDNPTMAYGVRTVEDIAEVVNRNLNPGATARVPGSVISPQQQAPDEPVP